MGPDVTQEDMHRFKKMIDKCKGSYFVVNGDFDVHIVDEDYEVISFDGKEEKGSGS